jgi:16S rRNA processing protein RimM
MPHRDLLAIGRVVKAFGVRGEIVVQSFSDSPKRFARLRRAWLGRNPSEIHEVEIRVTSIEPRGVRVRLMGVEDRSAAASLVGSYLFVGPKERVKVPPGRHFIHEIVGYEVVDAERGAIGRLRGVLKLPAQDVYVVSRRGRDVLIPAVREFVVGIDSDTKSIQVRLIDGMLEE